MAGIGLLGLMGRKSLFQPELLDPVVHGFWCGGLLVGLVVTCFMLYRLVREPGKPGGKLPATRLSLLLLSFIGILFSLTDFFHLAWEKPAVNFLIFGGSWLLLMQLFENRSMAVPWESIREWMSRPPPAPNVLPESTPKKFNPYLVTLVVIPIAVSVMIVLSEIPNAGKTIIQPFSAHVLPVNGQKGKALTDSQQAKWNGEISEWFADCLVQSLSTLRRELQPEVMRAMPAWAQKDVALKLLASRETGGGIDAILGKTGELDLFGYKIPIGVFAAPLQQPLRRLLDVRMIRGSISGDGGTTTVLASSSTGETWKARMVVSDRPGGFAAKLSRDLEELAEHLAFQILGDDPMLSTGAMTRSRDAFQSFREGVKHWEHSRASQDCDALGRAVWYFQKAVTQDPEFEPAHYRLGLALQKDGQPAAAEEAFRRSAVCNPGSVAGRIAHAWTLYEYKRYYLPQPLLLRKIERKAKGADPRDQDQDQDQDQYRRAEARSYWSSVIRSSARNLSDGDLAAAYYGLCLFAEEVDGRYPLAYFYCKQSAAAYARISILEDSDPTAQCNEATVLNKLGEILDRQLMENTGCDSSPEPPTNWYCSEDWIDRKKCPSKFRPSSRTAKLYYDRASLLDPTNVAIRCNAFSSEYAINGAASTWEALLSNVPARLMRARELVEGAKFKRAMKEYGETLRLDPINKDALVEYAETFWLCQKSPVRDQASDTCTDDDASGIEKQDCMEPYAVLAQNHIQEAFTLHYRDHASGKDKARLFSTQGMVFLMMARPEDAIESLEKGYESLCEIRRNPARDHLEQAEGHLGHGSTDKALETLRKAHGLLSDDHFTNARQRLEEAHLLLGMDHPREAQKLLHQVESLLSTEYSPKAKDSLEKAGKLLIDGDSVEVRLVQARYELDKAYCELSNDHPHKDIKLVKKASLLLEKDRPAAADAYLGGASELLMNADSGSEDEKKKRAKEAFEKLKRASEILTKACGMIEQINKTPPEHAYYNDLRWLLAQSYVCACRREQDAQNEKGAGNGNAGAREIHCQEYMSKADAFLKVIRESEERREKKPFSNDEGKLLDVETLEQLCVPRKGEPELPVASEPKLPGGLEPDGKQSRYGLVVDQLP